MQAQPLLLKNEFDPITSFLPERKLRAVFDFATYLKDREIGDALLQMQMTSRTYHDWVGSDNDIYDEVFQDKIQ